MVSGRGAEPTPGQRLDISEAPGPLRDITSGRVVPRTLLVSEREDKEIYKVDSLSDSITTSSDFVSTATCHLAHWFIIKNQEAGRLVGNTTAANQRDKIHLSCPL